MALTILLKVQRRFFTLVEILIVIAILALSIGVIGFNIHRAMREQRFKSEVDLVVDYLRLAQNLMLIMNADAHVLFNASEKDRFISMKLKIDGSIDDSLLKAVADKEKRLYSIQFLEFYDLNKTHSEPNVVDVKFISKGSVMSKGIMRLSTSESGDSRGAIERYICLAGYPKPLFSTIVKTDDQACDEKKQSDFDFRLTQFTVQEIQAKQSQEPKSQDSQTDLNHKKTQSEQEDV